MYKLNTYIHYYKFTTNPHFSTLLCTTCCYILLLSKLRVYYLLLGSPEIRVQFCFGYGQCLKIYNSKKVLSSTSLMHSIVDVAPLVFPLVPGSNTSTHFCVRETESKDSGLRFFCGGVGGLWKMVITQFLTEPSNELTRGFTTLGRL